MMTKKRSTALANLKLLMVFPVITIVLLIVSSCNQGYEAKEIATEMAPPPPPPPPPPVADTDKDVPFEVVDEMPVFKGGEIALLKFVEENIRYPKAAITKGISGKVLVRFAIEADGKVDRVSVLRGIDPDIDKEAFRVVSNLPAFEKAAIKDGKQVPVWYVIPITFALK